MLKKLRTFFTIFNIPARVQICKVPNEPSAGIVRVEELSLLLANWSLEVVALFARLLSESHGPGFDPRLVRGSFSSQKSQLLSANGRSSGCRIATFNYECSTRSTVRLHNGTFQVENLHAKYFPKAPAALAQSNLHRALTQSNLHKATSAEHLHRAASAAQLGQSKSQVFRWENYFMRVIAQSHHDIHCIESSHKSH